jgi:hypothetical protein
MHTFPLNITSIGTRPALRVTLSQEEVNDKIEEVGSFFYIYSPEVGEIPVPRNLWNMLYELSMMIQSLK